jgi:hypothetical protein
MKRWMVVALVVFLIMPVIGFSVINTRINENAERIDTSNEKAIRRNIINSYEGCLDRNDLAIKLKTAIAVAVAGIPTGDSERFDELRQQGLNIDERPCKEIRNSALAKLEK